MAAKLKRLLSNPAFLTVFAFVAHISIMTYLWVTAKVSVREYIPYGYELGRVASSIAAGHGFSSPLRFFDTGPTVWFTPIYPYFVAGIFKIWGIFSYTSQLVIETSNCAFASLTVIPIYEIAKKTFGRGVAVGASWAWIFLPTSLLFPIQWIWDTSLAALLLALLFWATLAMREAKTTLAWTGYGALWAFGVLVNPSLLSVLPFLAGWALWHAWRNSLPWLKFSAAAMLVFALAMVPWTIRNYRVFGKFIVLRSNFGLELWLGNNPGVPDTWSPWLHPNDSMEEARKYKRMGEIPYMAEKQHEAFQFMRTHPGDTINFMFRRFVNNWLAITDNPAEAWDRDPLYLKAFIVMNVLLALFTWLGALFARRARPQESFLYLTVILVFPLIFYLTHSSLRYRFPMDPVMMVLAAYGVAYPISLWNARTAGQQGSVAPAPPVLTH